MITLTKILGITFLIIGLPFFVIGSICFFIYDYFDELSLDTHNVTFNEHKQMPVKKQHNWKVIRVYKPTKKKLDELTDKDKRKLGIKTNRYIKRDA